ncbi:MAG: PhzF family phenazine biosynthesis protein [Acidimicrobiales bacterium]
MAHEYVVCDVFTDRPLTGNQLAVFSDATAIPDELLQPLARELNFSETTFVYPPDDAAAADARIRIFTPALELPFAGHPTLGTAVVLGKQRGNLAAIRLQTGRGVVPLTLEGDSGRMVQPVPTVEAVDDAEVAVLTTALGIGAPVVPVDRYDNGVRHTYLVVDGVETVLGLRPDLATIAEAAGAGGTNVVAGRDSRWTSRMFAPGAGVNEDPATGSAAGPLAVHLARTGLVPWGAEIEIHQGEVMGRPSVLRAVASGSDDGIERVEVGGDVVIVGQGSFSV